MSFTQRRDNVNTNIEKLSWPIVPRSIGKSVGHNDNLQLDLETLTLEATLITNKYAFIKSLNATSDRHRIVYELFIMRQSGKQNKSYKTGAI
jgi:hypothetical protein